MDLEYGNDFRVKWTRFRGRRVPFLMQNTDGECPLICLANVLLLKGKVQLPEGCKLISLNNLCRYMASALPQADSQWVTSVLKSMTNGLIFNCKLDSTKALIDPDPEQLFLSFNIPIKHGLIAHPLEYGILSNLNYDQLLEKLAIYQSKFSEEENFESEFDKLKLNATDSGESKNEGDSTGEQGCGHVSKEQKEEQGEEQLENKQDKEVEPEKDKKEQEMENKQVEHERKEDEKELKEKVEEEDNPDEFAALALEFLERYATQITEYGLRVLKKEIPEGSLVALYRNNHFLVATLHEGQLFGLVTDSSFYGHSCIWESLESSEYFDENFRHYLQRVKVKPPKKVPFLEKFKRAFRRKSKVQ